MRSNTIGPVLIVGLALVALFVIYQWQTGNRIGMGSFLGSDSRVVEKVGKGKFKKFKPSDLQAGDTILAINGIKVRNATEAYKVLEALYQPGLDTVQLEVRRQKDDGKFITRTVELDRDKIGSLKLRGGGRPNVASYRPTAKDLYAAAESGNATAVAQILDAGGKSFENDLVHGQTALMVAVAKGNMEVVRVLLDHKADPNKAASDQSTPLMRAAGLGNAELVAALMVAGADPTMRNSQLQTASDIADAQGYLDVSGFIDDPSPTKFLTADQRRKIADPLRDMGLLKQSGYRPSESELSEAIRGYQREAKLPVSGIVTAESFGDLLKFARHYVGSKNNEQISLKTQQTLSRIFTHELAKAWTPVGSTNGYPRCEEETVSFTISPDQKTITWKSYRPGVSAGTITSDTKPAQEASFKVTWADQSEGYDTIFVQPQPRPIVGPAYQLWEIRDGTMRISPQVRPKNLGKDARRSDRADSQTAGPGAPDTNGETRGFGGDAGRGSGSRDSSAVGSSPSFLAACHS